MGHAKALLSLESPELRTKLADLIVSKNLNVRDTERESRKLLKNKKASKGKSEKEASLEEIEEQLKEHFGTKVELKSQKRGGTITLHYYSMEDLERLLVLFNAPALEGV